ncbi:MAG TPA: response regulator, partial [Chthonomonadales bacterium]|nr:response regulator [Chthonomonadales bacterium]
RLLSENGEQNLTGKQVEYASTIHSAGNDLLSLINEVLDLAKIESGAMEVQPVDIAFESLRDYVNRNFRELAQEKGLEFSVTLADDLPQSIYTDSLRLQQVVRNLLSNAIKFTDQGTVSLSIARATDGWSRDHPSLARAGTVIAFTVRDTGIGIPAHRHRLIFEAFQQGDGTTSRKYGGTGLGLSISREIAGLLGGEIRLTSAPGEGSAFTFYLPQTYASRPRTSELPPVEHQPRSAGEPEIGDAGAHVAVVESYDEDYSLPGEVPDDRAEIKPGDQVVLVVEDDPAFASVLLDRAHEKGFKGVVSTTAERVPGMVKRFKPSAITLDIRLPDMDGWTVLDRLKHDPESRHIPVHIITATEERQRGLKLGAHAFLQKPVTKESLDAAFASIRDFADRKQKRLLVVEDDEVQRSAVVEYIGESPDVQITAVGSGTAALQALEQGQFDCMVLDLGLPDMSGVELIEKLRKASPDNNLPIVVYTGKELSRKEETELRRLADTIILKDAKSPERLLDETTLFLHRVQSEMPHKSAQLLDQARLSDPVLKGKTVLIVDDDVRNIFALTSLLERHQMQVLFAENGKDAIQKLQAHNDVDIVLMDVMMPEMDGYETMRTIRKKAKYRSLPIIALTAKAMKGDREACLEAGASDYIAKPVDIDQILSLMRVWLYK